MRDIMEDVKSWRSDNEEIALATVVKASGSAPRQTGAKLAVTRTGRMSGSVSGGCVEGAVYEKAMNVLDTGRPEMVHYGISDELAWDVGLSCGGVIDVFIEPFEDAS